MGYGVIKFQKFKVALFHLHASQFDTDKNIEVVFELKALETKIEGVCSRSYCRYDNLFCHENNNNVFANDLAAFRYHDCSING